MTYMVIVIQVWAGLHMLGVASSPISSLLMIDLKDSIFRLASFPLLRPQSVKQVTAAPALHSHVDDRVRTCILHRELPVWHSLRHVFLSLRHPDILMS